MTVACTPRPPSVGSRCLAALTMGVSGAALLAWMTGLSTHAVLFPRLVPMSALTALCFLAAGAALWLVGAQPPLARHAARALALVPLAVGVFKFQQASTGEGATVDAWLSRLHLPGGSFPTIVSSTTGVAFIGLAVALWWLGGRRPRIIASQLVALGVFALAFVIAVAYLYHVPMQGAGPLGYFPMAPATSLLLLAVSSGIAFAHPGAGAIAVVTACGPGSTLLRRMLPAFILLPVLLGYLRLLLADAGLLNVELGIATMVALLSGSLCVYGWFMAIAQNREDAERRRFAELSRRREQEVATVLAHTPDIIARFDREFRHVYINPAVEAVTGRPVTDFLGRANAELGMPEDLVAQWRAALAQVFATGEPRTLEFAYTLRGQVRHFQSSLIAERGPDGEVDSVLGVTRDITETHQLLEELKAKNEQLLELDRLKANLVSTVSHELRTPLTSIVGYAEFLEDGIGGPLTPDQGRFVTQIIYGAQQLQRLVDDLLDYARLESGRFKLSYEEADLMRRLEDVVAGLEPQARERGVKLTLAPSAGPVMLAMDPGRVSQVATNLIGNALKFTEPGGSVNVAVTTTPDEVRVTVKDTGIGIPFEFQERLFERFYQVDPGLTRTRGGTGLGLSISKALVEAHGGRIGVTSEGAGEGSTFWFTLPRKATVSAG